MNKFYYDFHVHSCLSPCGDEDMTPNNIVNMAKLKGLDVIALTDHNSCANCEATVNVGKKQGLLVLPGMELCTSEEIHCVCLFSSLDGALGFGAYVRQHLPPIENRPDIFGEQLVMDEDDRAVGSENLLLINATDIGVNRVRGLAARYGGTAFPAHADKVSNGIVAILGGIPPEACFKTLELSAGCDKEKFLRQNPDAARMRLLTDSDAHYLWQISEREHFIETENPDSRDFICSNC